MGIVTTDEAHFLLQQVIDDTTNAEHKSKAIAFSVKIATQSFNDWAELDTFIDEAFEEMQPVYDMVDLTHEFV